MFANFPKVFLVIPCYNEEKRLQIEAFATVLAEWNWLELCFVDDGSSDGTAELIKTNLSQHTGVHLITNPSNIGKAGSVRAGINYGLKESNAELFGYWDADLATPFSELTGMVDKFSTNPQAMLVMGSRIKTLGKNISRKRSRHYIGRVFATLACTILQVAIYDTQCGAKLFTREFAEITFAAPLSTGWCFDIELLIRLQQHFKDPKVIYKLVVEQPLNTWVDIEGSKIRTSHFIGIARDMFRLFILSRFN